MTQEIPEEQWKILDKTYYIIGKTLNIASSDSTDEIFINNSTNIAFEGRHNQSDIIIEAENVKHIIKGQTGYIFSLFCALIGCKKPTYSLDDIQILQVLDKSYFGKIFKAQLLFDNQIYIIKTIRKKKLDILTEQTLPYDSYLTTIPYHPFIANLCFTIKNEHKYLFGYELAKGGNLLSRLPNNYLNYIKIYAAELTLALEHFSKYVKHPNLLKPKNVLVDGDGHLKLRINTKPSEFADNITLDFSEFTPEYIENQKTDIKSLVWFLGCYIYNMAFRSHPFGDETQAKTFKKILQMDVVFPEKTDKIFSEFIQKLLKKNPEERPTFDQIKSDPYFNNLDWDKVLHKEIIGKIASMTDTDNNNENPPQQIAEFENFSCDFSITGNGSNFS